MREIGCHDARSTAKTPSATAAGCAMHALAERVDALPDIANLVWFSHHMMSMR